MIKDELEKQRKLANTNPTEKQKKAENYKMGHIRINGFQISIENPKGSYRRGKDSSGKEWKTLMHHDYGYFTKTVGKDGDAIDVFIGPHYDSTKIFAVDQKFGNKFDETKIMFCFNNIEEAKKGYLSNYEKDWKGFWKITETDIDTFKKWLYDGHRQYKPFFQYKEIKKQKPNMKEIKLTESKLQELIKESIAEVVNRNDYDNDKAYQYDRVMDVQNAKSEVAGAIKAVIEKYQLKNAEIYRVLETMIKYFCPARANGMIQQ